VNKYNTTFIATMSLVIAVSLISGTAYAQHEENKTGMDKEHKYFVIQDTKTSVPDNLAPEHQQFHQIAVALPPQPNKIYIGEVSYSASAPVNVFVMQPLNTTVTQNATAVPLSNMEGGFSVSGSHILNAEVADHVDFAGSAVYFHSRSNEPFTVAYTAVGKTVEPTPLYK
jgi:hypothetical protein